MKTRNGLMILGAAVVLLLAACRPAATGGLPPAVDPELPALDAQATLAVWSAQGTAVAASTAQSVQATADAQAAIARATADTAAGWVTGTAVAAQSTAAAAGVATAAAQATTQTAAAQATATWDALQVRREEIAVEQTAAAGAYALSATATADAGIIAFMEREAEETIRERAAEVARRQMWNRVTPWLAGAVTAAAIGLLFLVIGGQVVERARKARPQQAGDTYVMWHRDGPMVIPPPRAALPAPRVESRPLLAAGPPAAVEPVRMPVTAHGHMLIAGETGSGKSTAAQLVAAGRERVRVLDPHWNGQDWAGHTVIGAGRDFAAIGRFMEDMRGLLSTRYAARAEGRDDFESMTVFVDEMPAIVGALGRDVRDFWREWLREGRKVGLYLVLLTQSTRVRTLGIEGEKDLLENFGAVLVLGKLATAEYPRLVDGMARPAVLHTMGSARPVVIPYHDPAAADVPPPVSTLPEVYATTEWPRREEPHAEPPIDPDNLDDRARQRIVDEYRRELVFRRVQLKLFPQYGDDGGRAFYVIRDVLADAGMIERDDGGRWRPSARALGY